MTQPSQPSNPTDAGGTEPVIGTEPPEVHTPGDPSSTVDRATGIEPWLREILRCPSCRGVLRDDTGPTGGPELVCTNAACGLAYRVDGGIPVMLVDEARAPQTPAAQG